MYLNESKTVLIRFFKKCRVQWSIKIIINSTPFDAQNAENCISELLDFKIFSALGTGEAVGLNHGLVCVCQWLLNLSL